MSKPQDMEQLSVKVDLMRRDNELPRWVCSHLPTLAERFLEPNFVVIENLSDQVLVH